MTIKKWNPRGYFWCVCPAMYINDYQTYPLFFLLGSKKLICISFGVRGATPIYPMLLGGSFLPI